MAPGSGAKKRKYGLLRGRVPLLSPESFMQWAEFDEAAKSVLRLAPPEVRAIAAACDRAARSLGFSYGPFELYTLARLQQDDAAQAVAFYNLTADLQAMEVK